MLTRTRLLRLALGVSLVAAMALPASGVVANSSANASLKHVFVIMLENHSEENVIGDTTNAPFINKLASTYGQAANYYGVTHPSLPNYVAAISGSNWFAQTDDPTLTFDNENLVDQLACDGRIVSTGRQL